MTEQPKVYPTKYAWIGEVLKPALGEHAQDYDLDAIAYDLLDWHAEYNEQGRGLDNHSGYMENPGLDFWEVVERHALDTEDNFTDETSEALDRLTTALKELREAHAELINEVRFLREREHQLSPFNREILSLLEKVVDEEKLIMDATKNQEQH